MRGRSSLLLFALVVLQRLPFLGSGFGLDPDAWRIAEVGASLRDLGAYHPSRLPGFPLFEGLVAAFGRGYFSANLIAALASGVAAVALHRSLHRLGMGRDAFLCAFACLSAPTLMVHGTDTMDYLPGLACVLSAFWALLAGRPALAGLLLGAAAGMRISHLIFVPLFALVLPALGAAQDPGQARLRLAAGSAVAAIPYLAVLGASGGDFFRFFARGSGREQAELIVLAQVQPEIWGGIGLAGWLALIAALAWRRGRPDARPAAARPLLILAGLACAAHALLFCRLPDEAEYLMPAVPFALIAARAFAAAWSFRILCAALIVAPFLHVGGGGLHPGPLLHDHWRRERELALVERVLRESGLRPEAVYVLDEWEPKFAWLGKERRAGRFLYTLPQVRQLDSVPEEAWLMPGAQTYGWRDARPRLLAVDARELEGFWDSPWTGLPWRGAPAGRDGGAAGAQ